MFNPHIYLLISMCKTTNRSKNGMLRPYISLITDVGRALGGAHPWDKNSHKIKINKDKNSGLIAAECQSRIMPLSSRHFLSRQFFWNLGGHDLLTGAGTLTNAFTSRCNCGLNKPVSFSVMYPSHLFSLAREPVVG